MDSRSSQPALPPSTISWLVPLIIAAVITLAHSSVLFSTYLRQDDWSAATWDFRNFVMHTDMRLHAIDELRPLSVPFIYFSDALGHHMNYGWTARLINIVLIAVAGVLTYRWQQTLGLGLVMSACFAICSTLTQPYELISSTGNYTVMIASVIMAQCACFLFYRGFTDPQHRVRRYLYGVGLVYMSLFSYPMATTFIFAFLLIYYFAHLSEKWWERSSFMFHSTVLTLLPMASIVGIGRLVYWVLHYKPRSIDRSIAINWDIGNKLDHWWMMLKESLNIEGLDATIHFIVPGYYPTYQPVIAAAVVFGLGILCRERSAASAITLRSLSVSLMTTGGTFLLLLTLAYSPALATYYYGGFPFRYALVVMAMSMYVLFWSAQQMAYALGGAKDKEVVSKVLCVVTLLMLLGCAHNLSRYIVGVHETELHYISSTIEREALPELKAGKPVALYLIMTSECIFPDGFGYGEYGFGMSILSPGWLAAGAIHVMRVMGYESIETTPTFKALEWDGQKVVLTTKWGYIIATTRNWPHIPVPAGTKEVLIDMSKVGKYW